jgi:flagellar assembly protein FliH
MIEFLIPQNLPIRAVAVTEPSADPPKWLLAEMARWALKQQAHRDVAGQPPTEPYGPAVPSRIDIELESLRQRQILFTQAADELGRATALVEKQLADILHELQLAAIELAHAIAAKLTFEAIETNQFPVENLVHEVMARLDTNLPTVVRLHPDDLAFVQQMPQIGSKDVRESIELVGDASLARGDCKAKAGEVSVVYELKHQIDEIRRQLLSTVNGHAET